MPRASQNKWHVGRSIQNMAEESRSAIRRREVARAPNTVTGLLQ
jgi:hypothetical protein